MSAGFPPYVSWQAVHLRLREIFPTAVDGHGYCTREMAGKTIFTLLYIGAVQGSDRYLAPKHVVRMTEAQAEKASPADRFTYAERALSKGFRPAGRPWYADNSREPIRDETIRQGFLRLGAIVERPSLPKTSSKPRYALAPDFAALFDPVLSGDDLQAAIAAWRTAHLDPAALIRMQVVQTFGTREGDVVVRLPDGAVRRMSPGESALITKAVIEEFAPRFLSQPAIVFVSESGQKVVAADAALAARIGLHIDQSALLPDIVLLDLGHAASELVLVFIEVVHTDGPIDPQRREALLALAASTHLPERQIGFVTAYLERGKGPSRAHLGRLAWSSFAWFASEPDRILAFVAQDTLREPKLRALMQQGSGG